MRESMASVLLSGIEARSGPGKDFPFLDVPWPEKISERTLDSLFDAAETCVSQCRMASDDDARQACAASVDLYPRRVVDPYGSC